MRAVLVWQHAVEHIDSALNSLEEAVRRAHAHQIARLVLIKVRRNDFQHLIHQLFRLAHRKPADGVAGKSMALMALALSSRKSAYMLPCTIPKSA